MLSRGGCRRALAVTEPRGGICDKDISGIKLRAVTYNNIGETDAACIECPLAAYTAYTARALHVDSIHTPCSLRVHLAPPTAHTH